MGLIDEVGNAMLWSAIASLVLIALSFAFSMVPVIKALHEYSTFTVLMGLVSFIIATYAALIYIVGYVIEIILNKCIRACRRCK
ncbi:hypothetical protein VMUT_2316 [Vulcanisaeta moutnovskia 768-28]|mgnify:CR=1 FL=1|uniref:Uncharacterized protein n=1 Tax=Vulcanisaeta moutnovskia (strain 768-28) TaxID=985053 RepID=F0QY22_VULM7|nr:hypothetical protein [Vulcanisaeta moutnovskia]ADY02508.1 hypothetical protein VMUT_2316 [Vulcanisaeta moutnovskia 768-28]